MLTDIAPLLLEAASPRDASRRTLDWLLLHSRARSIALWRSDGDDITLDISIGADADTLSGARTLWTKRDPAALEAGHPVTEGNTLLAATRPAGTYVYVDGVDTRKVDVEALVDGAAVAAIALRRGPTGTGIEPTSGGALRREELVATLRLNEWNIARVARVKGVTRKTIYDWLARYNIPRERVPK
jgi:Homeodomain-like domain